MAQCSREGSNPFTRLIFRYLEVPVLQNTNTQAANSFEKLKLELEK